MNLRDELQAIYDTHGRLTKRLVVDTARGTEGSELHRRLFVELSDDKAADVGRMHMAGELIRTLRVTYRNPTNPKAPERSVRAWHALPSTDDEGGYEFEPVDKVVQDPAMLTLVLREMERDWKALKSRYGHLREFAELIIGDIGEAA